MPAVIMSLQAPPTDGGFLSRIPTDPASIFVYLLLAVSLWVVWKGSRPKPPMSPPTD